MFPGGLLGISFALVSHGLNKRNLQTELQLLVHFYPKPVQFTSTRTAVNESIRSSDNRKDSLN